jgi:hypothetical protein
MLSIVGIDTLAPVPAQVRDKLAARRLSCSRKLPEHYPCWGSLGVDRRDILSPRR